MWTLERIFRGLFFFPSKGAAEGGLFFFYFRCLMTVCTAACFIPAVVPVLLPFPFSFLFFFLSASRLETETYCAPSNVLSSGLPLPAPGLPGSVFVSCLRGLGSGAERRLGALLLGLSLQSVSRLGRVLRLGRRRRLLQSAAVLRGPFRGLPALHGNVCSACLSPSEARAVLPRVISVVC